jgi:hypothetical protein
MCSNWWSVVGLTMDAIGFLIIAWEWRIGYLGLQDDLAGRIERVLDRRMAAAEGLDPEEPDDPDFPLNWNHVQQEYWKELTRRGRTFMAGMVLVIFGFLFQLIGSWPNLFKACS